MQKIGGQMCNCNLNVTIHPKCSIAFNYVAHVLQWSAAEIEATQAEFRACRCMQHVVLARGCALAGTDRNAVEKRKIGANGMRNFDEWLAKNPGHPAVLAMQETWASCDKQQHHINNRERMQNGISQ